MHSVLVGSGAAEEESKRGRVSTNERSSFSFLVQEENWRNGDWFSGLHILLGPAQTERIMKEDNKKSDHLKQ